MQPLIIWLTLLPSILCFAMAGLIATLELPGWGWFLLVGVIALCAVNVHVVTP